MTSRPACCQAPRSLGSAAAGHRWGWGLSGGGALSPYWPRLLHLRQLLARPGLLEVSALGTRGRGAHSASFPHRWRRLTDHEVTINLNDESQ